MKWLQVAVKELYGLFVDDGSLAIAILAWTLLTAFALPLVPLSLPAQASIWIIGLLVLFVENVRRSAKRFKN